MKPENYDNSASAKGARIMGATIALCVAATAVMLTIKAGIELFT